MTLWLVHHCRPGRVHRGGVRTELAGGWYEHRYDLSRNPAVALQAMGIWNTAPHQIWIENDEEPVEADPTPKPPYGVPSMATLAASGVRGASGLKMVSTFSGAGGSCLGFEWAGYHVVWAAEFVPAAAEVYRLNHPGVILDERDIRTVEAAEILEATGLAPGELDVLEGSPPCASFSTAGKRHEHWGTVQRYSEREQRTDDLFFEYVRLIDGLRPKVFVAENVSGLVKGVSKGYFQRIHRAMAALGYRVEARKLDAQWLGVPQARQRIFFQGVREDLHRPPAWPKPRPYRYSLAEALPGLTYLRHDSMGAEGERVFDVESEPCETIRSAGGGANTRYEVVRAELAAWGNEGSGYEHRKDGGEPPGRPVDEPAGPVAVRGFAGSHDYELRVTYDNGGWYNRGDITDEPSPPVTVGDGSLNSRHWTVARGRRTMGVDEPCPTVQTHGNLDTFSELSVPDGWLTHDPETGHPIALGSYALGPEYDRLGPGQSSERYPNLVRPDNEGPSPTVTAAGGVVSFAAVTHPAQRRKFTIGELRRICAFPDDFALTGSYAQRWERLGRAVPPPMAYAVAAAVREQVFEVHIDDAWSGRAT